MVWVPAGYALDTRLVLTDSRGNVQTGPLTRVEGGAWTGGCVSCDVLSREAHILWLQLMGSR